MFRNNPDEHFRRLERLAAQGDIPAQQELLQIQARLRGYPIGPWDDLRWFRDFEAGTLYLAGASSQRRLAEPNQNIPTRLIEGQCLYISTTVDEETPYAEHLNRAVNMHRVDAYRPGFEPADFSFDLKGAMWLKMDFVLGAPGYDIFVPGFMVLFSGDITLIRTIFYPYDYKQAATDEMIKLCQHRNLPMIQAYLDFEDNIGLEAFRPDTLN